MKLRSDSFEHGKAISPRHAFGKYNPETHVELSDNFSPHLAWSDVPEGTRSLVVICHDSDVPTQPDDVNREGTTVPATLPRTDFYHWVLVDIPSALDGFAEGTHGNGVTPRGKDGPDVEGVMRTGLNDYTDWFSGDADMEGQYFGWDGPCPPWNDELVHHYHFTVYALDVDRCPVEGVFRGPDVKSAMEGHILAQASIMGTYHIYPEARVKDRVKD